MKQMNTNTKKLQFKTTILPIAFLVFCQFQLIGRNFTLLLYKNRMPNSVATGKNEKIVKGEFIRIMDVQVPDIAVYLPSKRYATGQAVIICPGGGYGMLAYDIEGSNVAGYLNSIGVAGIVLKYRLPASGNSRAPHKSPLMDAQRAMRLVRPKAEEWNLDPAKIGIMGFSAGGHLASTLGTHFDYGNKDATDVVERESCRPDFMVLVYPVIIFTQPSCNVGSREALLGKNPAMDLMTYYSSELQIKLDTPPTFLVHADDDTYVPLENSLLMYTALREKKIPAELHVLGEGGHGFGLGSDNAHISSWTENLKLWLIYTNKYESPKQN